MTIEKQTIYKVTMTEIQLYQLAGLMKAAKDKGSPYLSHDKDLIPFYNEILRYSNA